MPILFTYLLKLSVALAAVYIFYRFVLRHLTFYNWNRGYLIAYTLIAFFIPLIDISPVLEKNEWSDIRIINWVPVINEHTQLRNPTEANTTIVFSAWAITLIILVTGILVMITRLMIQFLSITRIKKKSKPFTEKNLTIYQVDEHIIPFSFGNSIFINRNLHNEDELQEIIRHEFIHVKQKHSLDIIWGELLCLLNWYNPFAWLLKKAIRQNLEFIADNKVIENGLNKKDYQYLLLRVIGSSQFSVTVQFNFSSLKKRIAMMNKLKSTKRQLLRLLFLLPATAILLLAFRSNFKGNKSPVINYAGLVTDLETHAPIAGVRLFNTNTGMETVTDKNGYFFMTLPADKPIHVEMKYFKSGYNKYISHSFSLEKKDNKESISVMKIVAIRKGKENVLCKDCNSSISSAEGNVDVNYNEVKKYYDRIKRQMGDTIPDVKTPNNKGYYIDIKDNQGDCMVVIKDKDKKEVKRLLLTEWNEKASYYEDLYGEILSPITPEIERSIKAANPEIRIVTLKNNIATVTLINGKQEVYTLSLSPDKKAFEERCGMQEVAILPVETLTEAKVENEKPAKTATIVTSVGSVKPELAEVTVTGVKSTNISATTIKPIASTDVKLAEVTAIGVKTTKPIATNYVEQSLSVSEARILHLGGLTILDEGQYILLDGKEVVSESYGKLTGPYRITFVDRKDAEKNYGSKGKNGAILLETIK